MSTSKQADLPTFRAEPFLLTVLVPSLLLLNTIYFNALFSGATSPWKPAIVTSMMATVFNLGAGVFYQHVLVPRVFLQKLVVLRLQWPSYVVSTVGISLLASGLLFVAGHWAGPVLWPQWAGYFQKIGWSTGFPLAMLAIALLTGLLFGLGFYQEQQARLEETTARLEETELELERLQRENITHFLKNQLSTLHNILEIDENKEKALQFIGGLTQLHNDMRHLARRKTVSLTEELAIVRAFIRLREQRYYMEPVKIEAHSLEDETFPPSLSIIPIVFLELVVNAFKFGVETPKKSGDEEYQGKIFIHFKVRTLETAHAIHFEVLNSYWPKSKENQDSGGTGLKNLQNRLEHAYPDQYTYEAGLQAARGFYRAFLEIQIPFSENQ